MYIKKLIFVFSILISVVNCNDTDETLEQMSEEELTKLLEEENNVIVLLCKKETCDGRAEILEASLVSVREDLVEETNAWVIKSHAPSLSQGFGVKDSAVIYIRSGSPVLYTGPDDDEQRLLWYISSNKVSSLHHLNDKTFEHQTQVASGATTGDWLIMFTKDDCDKCTQMIATLEAVAANLKGKKNVAIVHRDKDGGVTTRRFGAKSFPSFIFFRLGSMYRYELPVQDVSALTAFIENGFHNAKKLSIPKPKTPFDDLVEAAVDWLKENPYSFFMTAGSVVLAITLLILLNRPPPESWAKKKKKKSN